MQRMLCIHGHFYQPPREDPWLSEVLPEGSAAPGLNWNERICRESYAPLGWARRLNDKGKITEIVNCYEWMSFNFGPTLLSWMERGNPNAYARVLAGDKESQKRWGHGNAMAQVHHHIILPLASEMDKRVETAWGLADFEARFGRKAEGMWLSEAAVDTPSLEVLAEQGVQFVVLAPRQAKEIAPLDADTWTAVDEGTLDVTRAYLATLPSGRSIHIIFYDGPLSQAVAFERLLENGENFWQRISGYFAQQGEATPTLLPMATDGETYGHHFMFGEMALAYVLAQAQFNRDQVELGNFGLWLEQHPPELRVRLHEPSSWSCVHGVERWRSDCGCTTGGHPGWNQKWRAPLREALDVLKARVDNHFHKRGGGLFKDATAALLDYGTVLARSKGQSEFARLHFMKNLGATEQQAAWRLLSMQQWALASFASCAWFFDEISRIEPMNGLTYALRAMQLSEATGGPEVSELEAGMVATLARAQSNMPDLGTGADLWKSLVAPRREGPDSLVAQAFMRLHAEGKKLGARPQKVVWQGVSVSLSRESSGPASEKGQTAKDGQQIKGKAAIAWNLEHEEDNYSWEFHPHPSGDLLRGGFKVAVNSAAVVKAKPFIADELSWNKLQALSLAQVESAFESAWQDQEGRLRQVARLAMPWQESQVTQNLLPLWRRQWPVIAWLFIQGEALPEEVAPVRQGGLRNLQELLKEVGREHPDRELVGNRVAAYVLELLDEAPPLWESALQIVQRAKAIELEIDWWPVQNRLWAKGIVSAPQKKSASSGQGHVVEKLVALLGFNVM